MITSEGPQPFKNISVDIDEVVLTHTISSFFLALGMSEKKEKRLLPMYVEKLKKFDQTIMNEVLLFLSESWISDNGQVPTVPQIIEHCKTWKARDYQRRQRQERRKQEKANKPFRSDLSNSVWEIYSDCREQGIKDIRVIARRLQMATGVDPQPEKHCPYKVCDGKGWISAYRESDPMKSEILYSCKCNLKTTIGQWDFQTGWIPVRGLNEIRMRR